MKKSVLEVLREINQHQKELSDQALSINSDVTKLVNSKIDNININYLPGLAQHFKSELVQEAIAHRSLNEGISRRIHELDLDDPNTEVEEIMLDRVKLRSKVDFTRKCGNIIEASEGDLGTEYRKLKVIREWLSVRNQTLTNEHLDNVRAGIQINREIENENNSGSLVDDYADLNLEQPGYMDPED